MSSAEIKNKTIAMRNGEMPLLRDGLFFEYYCGREVYAQTVADTRHYYTHYGKSKEKKH